jgi:hypothetical protein
MREGKLVDIPWTHHAKCSTFAKKMDDLASRVWKVERYFARGRLSALVRRAYVSGREPPEKWVPQAPELWGTLLLAARTAGLSISSFNLNIKARLQVQHISQSLIA